VLLSKLLGILIAKSSFANTFRAADSLDPSVAAMDEQQLCVAKDAGAPSLMTRL
jgi:hypothetical protein